MFAKDLRELKKDELIAKLAELKSELGELKFQVRIGQEADTAQMKENRADIARIMTVLNESESQGQEEVVQEEEVVEKEEIEEEEE